MHHSYHSRMNQFTVQDLEFRDIVNAPRNCTTVHPRKSVGHNISLPWPMFNVRGIRWKFHTPAHDFVTLNLSFELRIRQEWYRSLICDNKKVLPFSNRFHDGINFLLDNMVPRLSEKSDQEKKATGRPDCTSVPATAWSDAEASVSSWNGKSASKTFTAESAMSFQISWKASICCKDKGKEIQFMKGWILPEYKRVIWHPFRIVGKQPNAALQGFNVLGPGYYSIKGRNCSGSGCYLQTEIL